MDWAEVEKQRHHQRKLLDEFGISSEEFLDYELDGLARDGYTIVDYLKIATREGLQRAGLRAAQVDQVLIAQGSAVALGPGSTGAGDAGTGLGPGSTAAGGWSAIKHRLKPSEHDPDLFFLERVDNMAGDTSAVAARSSPFFLDPGGRLTKKIRDWFYLASSIYFKGEPIPPLMVNGPAKTGKSFLLNKVLPALARAYFSGGSGSGDGGSSDSGSHDSSGSGGGQQSIQSRIQRAARALPEPNFLQVSCLDCPRGSGVAGFFESLLFRLKERAAEQGLLVAASTPEPSNPCADSVLAAIRKFMKRLPPDRLTFLLIDEAQCFYLLERPAVLGGNGGGPDLNWSEIDHMQRVLKGLLLDSPPWVSWALTGSCMATVWMNIAATPTCGYALLSRHCRINLDAKVSVETMKAAWKQLEAQHADLRPALPDDLLWQSPQHHAMLSFLCEQWEAHGRAAGSAATVVEQAMLFKVIPEVLEDLHTVRLMLRDPRQQLLHIRELLNPLAGVDVHLLPLNALNAHNALDALLGCYTTVRDGRQYLEHSLLAEVLQAVITESGELVESPNAACRAPSFSSPLFRELSTLGECCQREDFRSYPDLGDLLGDMASALGCAPDQLLEEDWFVEVLEHPLNGLGAKAAFEQTHKGDALQDCAVGLRWFHALQRNVLHHGSIPVQRRVLESYPPSLKTFHANGRISRALTKTYNCVAAASQRPRQRQQVQPRAGHMRPPLLISGRRLVRAAGLQSR